MTTVVWCADIIGHSVTDQFGLQLMQDPQVYHACIATYLPHQIFHWRVHPSGFLGPSIWRVAWWHHPCPVWSNLWCRHPQPDQSLQLLHYLCYQACMCTMMHILLKDSPLTTGSRNLKLTCNSLLQGHDVQTSVEQGIPSLWKSGDTFSAKASLLTTPEENV